MFDSITGHPFALRRLEAILQRDRLASAYIFSGPNRVGKRQVALEVIASRICTQSPSPCKTCQACRAVFSGQHEDVKVVARAPGQEELSIQAVREIEAFILLKPIRTPLRAVLIDDADLLSEPAMNALLKTLEEPPSYGLVILIASSLSSLLPTLRSRCHIVRFGILSDQEMGHVMAQKISSTDPLWPWVARLSCGRPGEALRWAAARSALEQGLREFERAFTPGTLESAVREIRRIRFERLDEEGRSGDEEAGGESRETVRVALRIAQEAVREGWRASITSSPPRQTEDSLLAPLAKLDSQVLLHRLETLLDLETALSSYANPNLVLGEVLLTLTERQRSE
jgi:hypothetical protein